MALIDSSKVWVSAGDDADQAVWFRTSFRLMDEHIEYRKNMTYDGMKTIRTKRYELELSHEDVVLRSMIEKKIVKTEHETVTEYRILENDGLAFDHAKIIAYALERLKGKVEYTDLALHMMPKEFTLTQLQQVYEVILGKTLLKAAFRRKIAHLVEETDSFTENEGHRPSRLFRRKLEEE
jgi:8-oxo-dGTP diphosphatase